MKLSENWLRERVALDGDSETLARRLDMIGHEVEGTERIGAVLDGVVVAKIVACTRHPEADRLQVCEVDTGGDHLQIVCGAPNARAGLKAPLATIGARVGALTIKAANLRGVESSGMLCSAKELGLDADATGLLELPADAPVGEPLAHYLKLPDTIFDLGLTPNRADCLSVEGIAADVAAAFDVPAQPLVVDPVLPQISRRIDIRLEAPADCPRYCGRFIDGIDAAAPTPEWLRARLRRGGLRPISLLVDVTNYVMLELGQPLHAFDSDFLTGPIGVRRAHSGETLRLLDERYVALDGGFLVITDADRPVALGGLMGGWDTRVQTTTRNVFLEAAHFAPAALAGRARRLGMHSDAAHRFERGVDPELPRRALERATRLIIDAGGGKPGEILETESPAHLPPRNAVRLRRARIGRVLGIEVGDADVERILRALDMHLESDAEGWHAIPPSRRFDIAIEEDLIEEIARIHGYDRIPERAPSGELAGPELREDRIADGRFREQLAARGYLEAITYAFVAADQLATWGMETRAIALANPLSAEFSVMRTSLLPGLVAALASNRSRQQTRVRLFEVGRAYRGGDAGPVEIARIAGVACGAAFAEQWGEAARAVDYFDIKGDIESMLALSAARSEFQCVPHRETWLHPGQAAELRRGNRHCGYFGAVHPSVANALGLDEDVYVFELDLEMIAVGCVPHAQALSRFPSVRRDLSIELPESVAYALVEATVRKAIGETLVDVVLFDSYAGPNLGAGIKSLAMGLILQEHSRTLTDQDADRCVALAIAALELVCKARLRG